MPTVQDFFAFMRLRHGIYCKRLSGEAYPWTDDPILQTYSFTNVFRELDKVTVWFAENARTEHPNYLMNCVTFRLFNRIITGEAIFCQTISQNGHNGTAYEIFMETGCAEDMRDSILSMCGKGPYCTGSYIINSPNGMDKLTGVLKMIQWVYDDQDSVLNAIATGGNLKDAWHALRQFPHIADFTSYEIVTDLRWTPLLDKAPDIMTWANPGPGAMRGLNRIYDRDLNRRGDREGFIREMQDLLHLSSDSDYWPSEYPSMEMRDIEHSLCEFDKYERVRTGQGKPRGRFIPPDMRKS